MQIEYIVLYQGCGRDRFPVKTINLNTQMISYWSYNKLRADQVIPEKISEVIGYKVYTDSGDYFGEVEEANLSENKIEGWRIKVGGSILSLIGGAKGVIIPHQLVKAVSEVMIISKAAIPNYDEV